MRPTGGYLVIPSLFDVASARARACSASCEVAVSMASGPVTSHRDPSHRNSSKRRGWLGSNKACQIVCPSTTSSPRARVSMSRRVAGEDHTCANDWRYSLTEARTPGRKIRLAPVRRLATRSMAGHGRAPSLERGSAAASSPARIVRVFEAECLEKGSNLGPRTARLRQERMSHELPLGSFDSEPNRRRQFRLNSGKHVGLPARVKQQCALAGVENEPICLNLTPKSAKKCPTCSLQTLGWTCTGGGSCAQFTTPNAPVGLSVLVTSRLQFRNR